MMNEIPTLNVDRTFHVNNRTHQVIKVPLKNEF